jgi:hypothetical protein
VADWLRKMATGVRLGVLAEHGAVYDEDENVIRTAKLKEQDLPRATLAFVALLLRVFDFLLLTQERVENTFKDDATRRFKQTIGGRAVVHENIAVSDRLKEVIPDLIVTSVSASS